MNQLNGCARQTSWSDQFSIFEALTSLHILRMTFQFVRCHRYYGMLNMSGVEPPTNPSCDRFSLTLFSMGETITVCILLAYLLQTNLLTDMLTAF